MKGVNDLAALRPELAKEWHPTKNGDLKPSDVTEKSGRKVWWQCEQGHEWESLICNRSSGAGTQCPYCTGHKPIIGETDLATLYPNISKQWHPTKNGDLKPADVLSRSNRKIWWICEHGHEWKATVSHRTNGSNCPYCVGKLPIIGETDLTTTHPEIAAQWHPTKNGSLKPTDVTRGSSKKKVWWICERGHEWESTVLNRVNRNSCPYCSGFYPIAGKTDLATTHPELEKQWHPTKNGSLKPTEVTHGSWKKVWWICKYGHEWESIVANRASGNNCPVCSGRRVVIGENDLATTHPELASQWHLTKNGVLKPTDVTKGCRQKVWWQCEYGHEWSARISSRTNGNNCSCCNESKGEKAIRKVLEDNCIIFKREHKFKDRYGPSGKQLLKDDFAIFDKQDNVVGTIEYNGIQHYEPIDFAGRGEKWAQKQLKNIQNADLFKSKYLKSHDIPQLIIPYWEFNNIEYYIIEFIKELSTKYELKNKS